VESGSVNFFANGEATKAGNTNRLLKPTCAGPCPYRNLHSNSATFRRDAQPRRIHREVRKLNPSRRGQVETLRETAFRPALRANPPPWRKRWGSVLSVLPSRPELRVVLAVWVMHAASWTAAWDAVRVEVADGKILNLVEQFLTAGVMDEGQFQDTTLGTPQGGVISPLLANIVLNRLDGKLEAAGYRCARYAADFVILCRKPEQAQEALTLVRQVLETELPWNRNSASR